FKESQKFNQPLLWGIILSAYLLTHVMGIRDIVGELAEGDNWWASEAFIAAFIGLVLLNLLVVLFLLLRLETRIDRHGVHFRYPPVITSWRKIPYVEIQSIEVVRYSPWAYGGWGIRYNWHGWAYNVRGKDRKSTRLNSSHVKSSYAVFCLKKKTTICRPIHL